MKFARPASELNWTLLNVDPLCEIGAPSIDSRTILPGQLFWALKGVRDGGQFALDALNKGAQAAVVEQKWVNIIGNEKPLIVVKDTLQAFTDLASLLRKNFSGQILALTGSCGKTTAKELIYSILTKKFRVLKNPGNYNNHIGIPFTLCQLNENYDLAVLEMGANHPGEITHLCNIAQPDAGLITMIGKAHLEGFGDLDGVARAKGELFHRPSGAKTAFVNLDDANVVDQSQSAEIRLGYGFNLKSPVPDCAKVYPGKIEDGTGFSALNRHFHFPFPGFFMNLGLAAVAVGDYYKVPIPDIAQALKAFNGVPGRMNKILEKGIIIYDDTYNCNPSSLKAALEFISLLPGKRKMAVLGDMLELGDHSLPEHQRALELCRKLKIRPLFTLGPQYAQIPASNNYSNVEDLVTEILKNVQANDVILFKASRSMKLEAALNLLLLRLKTER